MNDTVPNPDPRSPAHAHCADGWICEHHPWRPWPHREPDGAECPAPGIACSALAELLRAGDEQTGLARDVMRTHAVAVAERFAEGADAATAAVAHLIAASIAALPLDTVDVEIQWAVEERRRREREEAE